MGGDIRNRIPLLRLVAALLLGLVIGFVTSTLKSDRADFSSLHWPIVDFVESSAGVAIATVVFVATMLLRRTRPDAWVYAFLAGVGAGHVILSILAKVGFQ